MEVRCGIIMEVRCGIIMEGRWFGGTPMTEAVAGSMTAGSMTNLEVRYQL